MLCLSFISDWSKTPSSRCSDARSLNTSVTDIIASSVEIGDRHPIRWVDRSHQKFMTENNISGASQMQSALNWSDKELKLTLNKGWYIDRNVQGHTEKVAKVITYETTPLPFGLVLLRICEEQPETQYLKTTQDGIRMLQHRSVWLEGYSTHM